MDEIIFNITVDIFIIFFDKYNFKIEPPVEDAETQEIEDPYVEPFLTCTTNKANIDVINEKWVHTYNLEKQGLDFVAYEREPLSILDYKEGDDQADFIAIEIRMV